MERDPRYREDLRERARELYESGSTTDEVAEAMDISRSWAMQLLHESGARMRRRGRPRKRRENAPRGR